MSLTKQEYLKALKSIRHPEIIGKKAEEPAAPAVQQMFHSLVMAVAYILITRIDICIYCVALQRVTAAPTNLHVRRLSALVRWAQSNLLVLKHNRMKCGRRLRTYTDAGFKGQEIEKEATLITGRAVRGAVCIRMSDQPNHGHLFDWHCGSIKQVTRSTFASEALAAIAATDHSIMLAYTLEEIQRGPRTPTQGLQRIMSPPGVSGVFKIEVLLMR